MGYQKGDDILGMNNMAYMCTETDEPSFSGSIGDPKHLQEGELSHRAMRHVVSVDTLSIASKL